MSGLLHALKLFASALTGVAAPIVWLTSLHSSVTVEPPASVTDEAGETAVVEPPTHNEGLPLKAPPTRRVARRRFVRLTPRRRRTLLALGTAVATLALVSGVIAFFTAGSEAGDGGAAQAGTLDAGNQPAGAADDRDITVSWEQNTPAFLGGLLGDEPSGEGGYLITRYADGDNTAIPAGDDCDGLRRGAADPLDCTETDLPTGRWQYTVTPQYYNWLGDESDKSDSAIVAPEAPDAVTLVNGGGVGNVWVNQANQADLEVDVDLPATSFDTDTVHLTISDGSDSVSADLPATAGAGTVTFTDLDVSSLADGPLTFTANVESFYTDLSDDTTSNYDKDATSPTVIVSPDTAPDHNGWYNDEVVFSTAPGSFDNGSGLGVSSCDADLTYTGPDGTDLTVELDCTDIAGNTGTGTSADFDFDDTNPIVDTVTPDRTPDHNGWYNAPVTWTAAGSDDTSGIDTCESIAYTGPDGSNLTVTRICTDVAGNSAGGSSPAFDFDDTNPSVTVSPDRGPDSNGWYNAPVTFSASGTDPTSGVAGCQSPLVYSSPDGTGLTVSRTCTDVAGNVGSGASAAFDFDDTNPSVTVSPDRGPDSNGWYNAPVTFSASGTDPTSGVAGCQSPLVYSSPDGTGLTVSRTCTDVAGNVGSGASAAFDFDDTNPSVTVSPDRGPDSNGWYNAPVTFSASGTDPTSGVAGCQSPLVYSSPDGTGLTVSRTCTDVAGNVGSGASATFKFDSARPSSTITFPATGGTYNNASFAAGCPTAGFCGTASDALSGVSSVSVSIQRQSTGLYWNGTSFASASQVFVAATGTTSWSLAFSAINFPAEGAFVASARATDAAANVQSPLSSATFTIDRTAPALQSLEMFDTDGDGKVDQLKASFNEALAPYSAGAAPWTLSNAPGGPANVVASGSESGLVATLTLTEGNANTAAGTYSGATLTAFTVALAANANGIRDAAGNQSSFGATNVTDKAAPVPTNVVMADTGGGGHLVGRMDVDDHITVTYSERLDASSLCSTWDNIGATETLVGNMVVDILADNNAASDLLSVADVTAANCGGPANFRFGSVNLAADYVSNDVTFTGNGGNQSVLTWDPAGKTLRIELGTVNAPANLNSGVAASAAIYTPSTLIKDLAGNFMTATGFTAPGTSRF